MSGHTPKPGHLGVQLGAGLLVRSTTQTAIVLGAGMGFLPPPLPNSLKMEDATKPSTRFRGHATLEMMGVLRASLIGVKIVEIGIGNDSTSKKVQREFARWQNETYPDPVLIETAKNLRGDSNLKVDLVLTPIDGADSLADGASGSVSVAAAGEPGCFATKNDDASAYLTVVVPKHSLNSEVQGYLSSLENSHAGRKVSELLQDYEDFEQLVRLLFKWRNVPPVVAVTLKGVYARYKLQLKTWHRKRILEGSVVANALASFLERVDCSVFITRWPQLIQVATAAIGLGGEIVAIPLNDQIVASGSLLRARAIVLKDNAVLCATSISEICILDRVRFQPNKETVTTDSVTVSLATARIIRQTDTFSLDHANARDPLGREVYLRQRIKALWQTNPELEASDAQSIPDCVL